MADRWAYRVACLFAELAPKAKGEQEIDVQNTEEGSRLLRVLDKATGAELARGEGKTYREALKNMRKRHAK